MKHKFFRIPILLLVYSGVLFFGIVCKKAPADPNDPGNPGNPTNDIGGAETTNQNLLRYDLVAEGDKPIINVVRGSDLYDSDERIVIGTSDGWIDHSLTSGTNLPYYGSYPLTDLGNETFNIISDDYNMLITGYADGLLEVRRMFDGKTWARGLVGVVKRVSGGIFVEERSNGAEIWCERITSFTSNNMTIEVIGGDQIHDASVVCRYDVLKDIGGKYFYGNMPTEGTIKTSHGLQQLPEGGRLKAAVYSTSTPLADAIFACTLQANGGSYIATGWDEMHTEISSSKMPKNVIAMEELQNDGDLIILSSSGLICIVDKNFDHVYAQSNTGFKVEKIVKIKFGDEFSIFGIAGNRVYRIAKK